MSTVHWFKAEQFDANGRHVGGLAACGAVGTGFSPVYAEVTCDDCREHDRRPYPHDNCCSVCATELRCCVCSKPAPKLERCTSVRCSSCCTGSSRGGCGHGSN